MKKNEGLTLISLVITIIILLILAGVSLNMILGENGLIAKATTVEVTFNKSEVIEELNILATEKYLAAYNEASANNDVENMSKYYSPTKVINFLCGDIDSDGTIDDGAKKYIELLENYTQANDDTRYFVIVSSLGRNIDKYGTGANDVSNNDYFFIKVTKDGEGNVQTAKVFYKNLDNVEEEIGDLVFTPSV